MNPYHKSLNPDIWRKYDFPSQVLMVANELQRAGNALRRHDPHGATLAYARALELLDLTVAVNRQRNLLRELFRWRDLAAAEYLNAHKTLAANQTLLKTILLFSAASAKQIPHLVSDAN